ncbi:glycosyltransferase [Cellulomonas marina]|uniref:Glycosyltransferase involved in cell wall bisynthesis n=1 Tax=Cellulomonas marina TaxID=988821 RepID=A0A1I0ZRS3_9CELL|nr:glycosyltransferase [Cellulomonas marina]GIG28815.1 polysaccharide synthesis protein GtrA [Cellulomonas marina]SFB28201.1 Glycosyltransferase involved in cell wall bisynthesis [Cellulomonas marina]
MIVLVPALDPDERLVALADALHAAAASGPPLEVVVVDDGSGPAGAAALAAVRARGVVVLTHPVNRGKGAALRTGVAWVLAHRPGRDVVCADSDGQHAPADVLAVARRVATGDGAVVLGVRAFTGPVPMRSRVGNEASRLLFRLSTGQDVVDTQTGLRGYPAALLPDLLTVTGDRFEYELRLLLHLARSGVVVEQHPIATIYLESNASSHFRPVADSLRVMAPLVAFALSSLLGAAVDVAAFAALLPLTGSLALAVGGARAVSAAVNFLVNRHAVFASPGGAGAPLRRAAGRYVALALLLLAGSLGVVTALTDLGVPAVIAKVLADLSLFVLAYGLQSQVVFAGPADVRRDRPALPPTTPTAPVPPVEDRPPTASRR